jgi:hypothetical protein
MKTITNLNKETLEVLVKQSYNMSSLLTLLNLIPKGGNYRVMNRKIKMWNIDISHWGTIKQRQGHLKGKTHDWAKRIPLNEILVKNSTYGGGTYKLKNRLLKENIFEHKCYRCNNVDWLNNPIPLELEHINGDNTDNSRENLTLLCPNCHALTNTYRGKNKKHNETKKFYCKDCGKELSRNWETCQPCWKKRQRKVVWPTKEELEALIKITSMTKIGEQFGVSGNAVKKWCKSYGIDIRKK